MKIKNYYVYELKFPNNAIYIGQTANLRQREFAHRNRPSGAVFKFFKKFGYCNFKFNPIYKSKNIDEILLMEKRLIDSIDCINKEKSLDFPIIGQNSKIFNLIKKFDNFPIKLKKLSESEGIPYNTLKSSLARLKKKKLIVNEKSVTGINGYSVYRINK